jgi:signal transduction histidine kinase
MGFAVPRDLTHLQTSGHFGLVGMTERARTVGGDLDVDSAPGAGTTIVVRVPLPPVGAA